jgi:hypothetical protein
MKQIALFVYLLVHSVISFSQELTTNKTETVALLTAAFKKANGLIMKYPDGDLTISDCQVSFERGMLIIQQTLLENNAFYSTNSYHFSPLDIESVVDGSRDYAREKDSPIGDMRINVQSKKVFWKSRSLPENKENILWHNSIISLRFFYDEGKEFMKIEKALFRLKKLLQAEADPFELTADEKRLSALFAKYKYVETNTKPNQPSQGKKLKIENMLLTLTGPSASYYKKQTTTRLETDDEMMDEENRKMITEVFSHYAEFWWRNVSSLKFHTATGGMSILSKGMYFSYKNTNLNTKTVNKGATEGILTMFKPGPADRNGEAKKDILEMMSLIKKIVKLYGGGDVVSEVLEN